ncbi:hypothetical protein SAMN06269185_0619 [Natronoarchaeum philippinense]|uniref:Matrixin n=1 Tax=Natronoarchaeum philippinense TaxID=558529 RepID=A0A285NAB4_NATPI|nr:hypothetical protein SAMN06269185_0619 [Natronoarchaeum philippinense]
MTEGSRIEEVGGSGHPWDGEPITLGIAYEDGLERSNFPELTEAAATFWEGNDDEYLDYQVEYVLDADAAEPDVLVTLVSEITTCERSSEEYQVVGCAPLITGNAPDTATVQILSGYSDELTRTTITHELGHTLGLGHDDEPARIMSGDPADRIPNYETRRASHDAYLSGLRSFNTGNEKYQDGSDALENERWAEASEAFTDAADAYRAAENSFESARANAAEIGVEDAVTICDAAEAKSVDFRKSSTAWSDAATARREGNYLEYQNRSDDARDHYDASQEHEIRNSDKLAVALGLQ